MAEFYLPPIKVVVYSILVGELPLAFISKPDKLPPPGPKEPGPLYLINVSQCPAHSSDWLFISSLAPLSTVTDKDSHCA